MTGIPESIKKILPPALRRFLGGIYYGWHGNYRSWADARARFSGYNSEAILKKVKDSAMKVKSGEAAYERDSYIFDEVQYSYPLLSALLFVAASGSGRLNIIDFGGSLGSSYFQNKIFLDKLSEVNWCVVEQPQFVEAGRESFEDNRLRFFYNITECTKEKQIDAILFSSVLQYLEKPFEEINKAINEGIKYIIIDRTPFVSGRERITVQRVNPAIYKASYPCRFFNKSEFIEFMNKSSRMIIEWQAIDKTNIRSEFCGFIFENNIQKS